jgi:hypothetical protein
MGLHCSFWHLKHKLWPKEGPGVKLPVWLSIRKSQESTRFTCLQTALDIPLESSRWGYNFASDHISIRGLLAKLWGSKVTGFQLGRFWDSHLGVPGQKLIWMWALWRGVEYTIRGKVVASPKFGPWWVLCVHVARGLS